MASVTFPTSLGGDGSTVTDDANASTGLANGGHRSRFVPSMGQNIACMNGAITQAAAQVTAATAQATNASNSAAAAAASATTALNAPGTQASSTTSVAIGLGSKSLTLAQTGKSFVVGQYVQIVSSASIANWMVGAITAFTPGTGAMTVNVTNTGGSGTIAAWAVTPTNPPELPSQSGNAGKFLKTDGSVESWDTPLPVQTGQAGKVLKTDGTTATWDTIFSTFVASGAITQGSAVQLKTTGLVEQVAGVSPSTGTQVAIKASNTNGNSAVSVSSSGAVVVAFSDSTNSNRLSVVVGTVSGTTISFGTAVQVNTDTASSISVAFIDATNFCIHYSVGGTLSSAAVIGTVSGTTASFGTKQTVATGAANFTPSFRVIWNALASRLVFTGWLETSSMAFDAVAIAASVSGTTLTFGTQVTVASGVSSSTGDAVYHAAQGRVIVLYSNSAATSLLANALTVSGLTVSVGPSYTITSGATSQYGARAAYDSNAQRILAVWPNGGTIWASHLSVTGSAIAVLATSASWIASSTTYSVDYSVTASKFVVRYQISTNSSILGVRLSGTTFLFDAPFVYNSTTGTLGKSDYSAAANKIISIQSDSATSINYAQVIQVLESNLEVSAKVLGIAQSTVANGANVSVATLGGVDTNQSGLTVNNDYYVSSNGTLTTTSTNNVLIGRAVAATKLLITKGN